MSFPIIAAWLHPPCFGCGVRHEKGAPCPNGTTWWTGLVACRVCIYRYIAIVPIPIGDDCPPCDLECSRCGVMACDPVEE